MTLTNGIKKADNFDCTYNKLTDLIGRPECRNMKFREGNNMDM